MGQASAAALTRAGGIVFAPAVRYGGSRERVDNRDRARDRAGTRVGRRQRRAAGRARALAADAGRSRARARLPAGARDRSGAHGRRSIRGAGARRARRLLRRFADDSVDAALRRDLQWRGRCVGRGWLEHQLRLRARARRHAVGRPAASRRERRVRVRPSCAVPGEARDRGRCPGGRGSGGRHRDAPRPRQLRDAAHSRRGRRAGALAAAARRVHAGRGGRRVASGPGNRWTPERCSAAPLLGHDLEGGDGLARVLAALPPAAPSLVLAQGTGPAAADRAELDAIGARLDADVPVTSALHHFGHTLGASGLLSAALAALASRAARSRGRWRCRTPAPPTAARW